MPKEKELATQKQTAIQQAQPIDEQTLKDFLFWSGTKLSDEQFKLFVWIAKSSNLNPFKREIYPIPFERSFKNSQWQWEKKTDISIVSGYQVYLEKASATGLLDGWKVELTEKGAKIIIYRKDFQFPVEWEVEKTEFQKTDKEWKLQWSWKTMPNFMIKKVVIWQGFRLAFPSEMWGLPYLQEEISSVQEWMIEEKKSEEIEKVEEIKDREGIEDIKNANFSKYYDAFITVLSLEEVEKITNKLKEEIKNDSTFITKDQIAELSSLVADIKASFESKAEEVGQKEVIIDPGEVKKEENSEDPMNQKMFEFYKDIFATSWRIDELVKFENSFYRDVKKYGFSDEQSKELLHIARDRRAVLKEMYWEKEKTPELTPTMDIETIWEATEM